MGRHSAEVAGCRNQSVLYLSSKACFPAKAGIQTGLPPSRENKESCAAGDADCFLSARHGLPQSAKWMSIARAARTACVRFWTPSFRRIAVM
jgi:hypothetical protein